MRNALFLVLIVFLLGFVLTGCGPAQEPAAPDEPAVALIENRCSTCHGLDQIYTERNPEEWPGIVETMLEKSPGLLDDSEFELVVEYLQEYYAKTATPGY